MNNEENKKINDSEKENSQSEYFDNCFISAQTSKNDPESDVGSNAADKNALNSSANESGHKKKNKKSVALKFTAIVLIALVSGALSGAGTYFLLDRGNDSSGVTGDQSLQIQIPSIDLSHGSNQSGTSEGVITNVTQVVESVMPAMVSINVTSTTTVTSMWGQTQEYEVQGSGSGIVITQSADTLFIATNHHVIDKAKKISVTFSDGKSYEASLKGSDSDYDLAVVSIPLATIEKDTLAAIRCAVLGSSDALNLGEPAIAIGNALGYGQSVTVGYISAVGREVQMEDKTMVLIQTDAAINPGNSGGALLNIKGEVIGINSSKYADTNVEGMGFAIPMSDALPIINEIINETAIPEDEQAYLGITGGTVNSSWVSVYGWPEGVYVSAVTQSSPAANGGVRAHDIIVKFDGRAVLTIDSLTEKLGKKRAGDTVEIIVMRQDSYGEFKEQTLTVTLGAKKDA